MPNDKPGWSFAFHELPADIIGRVLPGLIAITAALYSCICSWLWVCPTGAWIHSIPGATYAFLSVAILVVAWSIGMLIYPLGHLLWKLPKGNNCLKRERDNDPELFALAVERKIITHHCKKCPKDHPEDCDVLAGIAHSQIHEYLKAEDDEWRSMLMKLQAEIVFYASSTAALVSVILGSIVFTQMYYYGVHVIPIRWWLADLIPLGFFASLSLYGWSKRVETMWSRQFAMLSYALRRAESRGPFI
jgi:hypothetical protein